MMDDNGETEEAREAAAAAEAVARDHADGETISDTEPEAEASVADETGGDVLAWVTGMVGERPMLALLGAAAAGYALALLVHGGRR